jgi:hypothetical protein
MNASAEFSTLLKAGCLMNPDLYGLGIDATIPACRSLIWNQFLKPRCGNKTPLLGEPFFVMKTINLPRQALDKRRETQQTQGNSTKGVVLQVLRSRCLRVLA